MEAKDKRKIGVVFLLILFIAVCIDVNAEDIGEDGVLLRGEIGEAEEEMKLMWSIEGYDEEYPYELELEPMRATKEQAETYFEQAKQEIDKDFCKINEKVPLKTVYQEGLVQAKWDFEPIRVISADGTINWEKVKDGEGIVNANVTLSCGEYEQIYQFSFRLEQEEKSTEEIIVEKINHWLEEEMGKEGIQEVYLPKEIEGVALSWALEKDFLTGKVVFLEVVAVCLMWFLQKKQKEEEQHKLEKSMERDYPDIVEQMMLLLGAGMTIRQAWNRIATQYLDKRQKKQVAEKPVFERIIRLNRRLLEGENEKSAYQQFADETGLKCYHRFIRLLLGSIEKGAAGTCEFLEQESRQAYEERIKWAKKLGEEASTRMLLPLMIMLMLVMAIVMLPAILDFSM